MNPKICDFLENLWCADADSEMITIECVMTYGDSGFIRQITYNLVENVVKFIKFYK